MDAIINALSDVLLAITSVTGSLGWSIVLFTIAIRFILLPLTLSSIKATTKMRDIQPELKKLKEKHGKDKEKLQKAQMELYKKYNVNPLAGCIPQLVQIGLLIILYQFLINFLGQSEVHGVVLEKTFFWMDLSQADSTYILPIVAAVTQMILSLMIAPGGEKEDLVPNASKSKKKQEENKKEEDFAEMAASMQQQMLFILPIMTGFIATRFPSGVALYWVITTLFSIGQQYYVSGLGGLKLYAQRAVAFVQSKKM